MRIKEIIQEAEYAPTPLGVTPTEDQSKFYYRCVSVLKKIASAAPREDQAVITGIDMVLSTDPSDAQEVYALTDDLQVVIDPEEFSGAPVEVLIWLIAHEVGHIVMNHQGSRKIPAQQSQQQEKSADDYATAITLKLGITKVAVFTWLGRRKDQLGKTDHEHLQNLERDPKNADYFKNDARHPTTDQRIKSAGELGMELSKINTDQIDALMAHTA
jgi:predicted metal-dependent peptidase